MDKAAGLGAAAPKDASLPATLPPCIIISCVLFPTGTLRNPEIGRQRRPRENPRCSRPGGNRIYLTPTMHRASFCRTVSSRRARRELTVIGGVELI